MKKFCVILSLLLIVSMQSVAFAQDATEPIIPPAKNPINLTISPITLFMNTTPGVSTSAQIKIQNGNTEAETLKTFISTFTADKSGERPILRDLTEADTFQDWIHLSETNFTISPGEWKTITVTFSPPVGSSLSYYYSIGFERTVLEKKDGEMTLNGAPAILVLTTVNTPFAVRKLSLSSFQARFPFVEYLPQEFVVTVHNDGNVHLAPSGDIFIDSSSKENIALLPLNPKNSMVLPNSERSFVVSWSDGFPLKQKSDAGKSSKTIWDFTRINSFRFGKYTAHLLLVYDDGTRDIPVETAISFWVIPWKIILVVLLICSFTFMGLRATLLGIFKKRKKTTSS